MENEKPTVSIKTRLKRAGQRFDRTKEAFETAGEERDLAIFEAVESGMTLTEAASLVGIRRESAYYAKLRAGSRLGWGANR